MRTFLIGLDILRCMLRSTAMTTWTKPEFVDLRLGLEVTLYISNR